MAGALSKAQVVWKRYEDYKSKREDWADEAADNEDFFFGKQWTDVEIKRLAEQGMAPLVVNRTMPIIQQEIAIFMAKRPTFKYYPVDDGDSKIAAVFSDCAQHVWQISSGDSQYQAGVQDSFVTGVGYLLCYIDPYSDEGRGEVKFRSVSPWDVYPDPNSREIDLSDAQSIIISRRIDKTTLLDMYPDARAKINQAEIEEGANTDKSDYKSDTPEAFSISAVDFLAEDSEGKIRVCEEYKKITKKFYKIMDKGTGKAITVTKLPKSDALHDQGSDVRGMAIYIKRISVTVTAGENMVLDEFELKTDTYPVIPIFMHHRRNPYASGDVAIIKGMQQEVNKRRSIMIHNATLSGNHRILAEKNSITNKAEYEKKGSRPGFILEYLVGSNGQPPKEMVPQALPPAWIQLEAEAKGDMEYALSIFPHMMGSTQDAPETYRGLLALEEAGQRKIQYKARNARGALRQLGRVMMHLIQMTYSPQKMIRVVGEDNEEVKGVFVNEIEVDPFTGETRTLNDLTIGSYDLVVVDGTSMPTNKMALLNMYLEMYQLGIIDKEEVLKKTDIIDKEGVLKRIGDAAQLMSRVDQLEQELEQTQGLNQTIRRQLMQTEVHMGAQKQLIGGERELMRTTSAQELARARLKDEVSLLKRQMKLTERESKAVANNVVAKTKDQMMLAKLQAEAEANNGRK